MTDDERKLLDEHGVLILPDEINHGVFQLVLTATLARPDKPITLYCRGDGGDSCAALALVDVIQRHGQFIGLLPGEANSSHSVMWAACEQRYIFPGGSIGLHRCARIELQHVDAGYARRAADEFDRIDRQCARVMAGACANQETHGESFWYDVIDRTGSRGLTFFNAEFLIECGMAKPISEMPA